MVGNFNYDYLNFLPENRYKLGKYIHFIRFNKLNKRNAL